MDKSCVFFEVRKEFLHIIYTIFGVKGSMLISRLLCFFSTSFSKYLVYAFRSPEPAELSPQYKFYYFIVEQQYVILNHQISRYVIFKLPIY